MASACHFTRVTMWVSRPVYAIWRRLKTVGRRMGTSRSSGIVKFAPPDATSEVDDMYQYRRL